MHKHLVSAIQCDLTRQTVRSARMTQVRFVVVWVLGLIVVALLLQRPPTLSCPIQTSPSAVPASRPEARRADISVRGESPAKQACELGYWRERKAAEGILSNSHYSEAFTRGFSVSSSFYSGKKVLDIGCGPRGSLEWMKDALVRACADPLAVEYGKLGAAAHEMIYVQAGAEDLPFPAGSFDVVTSLNNLDHVSNASTALTTLARVLRRQGHFLLAVEIHDQPTACEPQALSWDLGKQIAALGFLILEERHHEIGLPYIGLYAVFNNEYDHLNRTRRDGYLVIRAQKTA